MLAADTAPSSLAGLEVVDRRGERLGRVRQVYSDGADLGWVGVRGNLFGTEEVLVPLDGAELEDEVIAVPVARARFQAAPRRRPDAVLRDDERAELRAFWSEPVAEPAPAPASRAQDGPAAPSAPPADPVPEPGVMTASEERLHVETERVPRTRVRLRKVVVTEQRTLTVPVRREEYRLIREPIIDGEPVAGGAVGPEEQEVVLHEERIVLTTEVVPVERVRLVKEDVVEQREVTGEVRLERIELEDDAAAVALPPEEPEVVDPEPEPVDAETVEPAAPQPAARAIAVKRPTSRTSPRRPGSTPARSRTSAAADAPPSTGASD
ncbi:uncharacterized protein (TIGR02271 family) [Amnibacterium kyonggiense]|uniref:Uncharacterized protein (TIGR02271 family) n=1 Tax=Amnibacterium kyonggiense TaxID=595671 RepID=A0A4R7FS61_9MICO|nr:uncharacterized protein (TIGR02271 family) [Amnibacterium kyonggiense]